MVNLLGTDNQYKLGVCSLYHRILGCNWNTIALMIGSRVLPYFGK